MLNQRTRSHQSIHPLFLSVFTTLFFAAASARVVDAGPWRVLESDPTPSSVHLKARADRAIRAEFPFFVITHGMGGTHAGDRFHRLADVIFQTCPGSNVVLIDWSEASRSKTPFLGLPNPHVVASRIDRIGDDARGRLVALGCDPDRATFVGESFGNWVNARIAKQLGGVERILAMNPASELGGYPLPDLTKCARVSWSFHTFSVFDTLTKISHVGVFLETPKGATDLDRHTCGIGRLTELLANNDRSWLLAEVVLSEASEQSFERLATIDGRLIKTNLPRERPTPSSH